MSKKIAFKLFNETTSESLSGWPSVAIEIDEAQEQDYIDAGYEVDWIFSFEALKDSMQAGFDSWSSQNKPAPKIVKITNLTDKEQSAYEPPFEIDFVAGLNVKLHRKSIIVKGECQAEEYYLNFTNGVFSDLQVKEETTYTRDPNGFVQYKDVVIKWALEDGSFHEKTKTWRKYYSFLEMIQEGVTRRGNLISNLQVPILGFASLALTGSPIPTLAVVLDARRFLAEYSEELKLFVDSSTKTIIDCLGDSAHPKYVSNINFTWIDWVTPYGITIRQYLISEMTI